MFFRTRLFTDLGDATEVELRRQTLLRFNYFLGYHHDAQNFAILVKDLRNSTSFHSFLTALPEVLDSNMKQANTILNITVALLNYCTTSQSEISLTGRAIVSNRNLSYLPPHSRSVWMKSFFILLF